MTLEDMKDAGALVAAFVANIVALGGYVIRNEVKRAVMSRDIEALKERQREDRTRIEETLKEIRNDVKSLLMRVGDND